MKARLIARDGSVIEGHTSVDWIEDRRPIEMRGEDRGEFMTIRRFKFLRSYWRAGRSRLEPWRSWHTTIGADYLEDGATAEVPEDAKYFA